MTTPREGMSRVPRQKPGYALRSVEGNFLIMNLERRHLLEVNQTAALIWGLCDGERDLAGIAAMLSRAFPEAAAGMQDGVGRAALGLVDLGCLEMD